MIETKHTFCRICESLCGLEVTLDDGVITHVFYPVFPPDRSAQQVIDWLRG